MSTRTLDTTVWQKPHFEDLAMNAEIGAYQPDDWDTERKEWDTATPRVMDAQAAAPPQAAV